MNIYEGMFVLDDKRANDNWDGAAKEVRGVLEKHGAQVYRLERWDERRLAYRIKGRGRGVYVLTGFLAPSAAIAPIERDCQLSDTILRVLVLRDEAAEKLRKQGLFDPNAPRPQAPPRPPEDTGRPTDRDARDARPDNEPSDDTHEE